MIKRIGIESRAELERLLESRVRLETRVKVQKNWRSKRRVYAARRLSNAEARAKLARLVDVQAAPGGGDIGLNLRHQLLKAAKLPFRPQASYEA